jgi:hypothetical protein
VKNKILIFFRLMKLRWTIIFVSLLLIIAALWLFQQNPPPKVEMTDYVPSDTLIYLETNDLPAVLESFTKTESWKNLAPHYEISASFGEFGWLSRLSSQTGFGSAETVVLGRSQIAVAVFGIKAADADTALKIRPRYAVVIETKTDESRAMAFVEKQVGEIVKKNLGEMPPEKSEKDGAKWLIWRKNERQFLAAVSGSRAIVGNDEEAVKNCLAVQRGEKSSLSGNQNLKFLRDKAVRENALTFGFVTSEGLKQITEIAGIFLAGQLSDSTSSASLFAQTMPAFLQNTVRALAWDSKLENNKIKDSYLLVMPPDLVSQLREPLKTNSENSVNFAEFLPPNIYSVTRYSLQNPSKAWRGVMFAMSGKMDGLSAVMFNSTADNLLFPYGIEDANAFLSAVGNEIYTIRLDEEDGKTVALVKPKETEKIKQIVFRNLGSSTPAEEKIGEMTLLTNAQKNDWAAAFVGDLLLFGKAENVRLCLQAKVNKQNLSLSNKTQNDAFIKTWTTDNDSVRDFLQAVAKKKISEPPNQNPAVFAVTETNLKPEGIERTVVSDFGLLGTLIVAITQN